MAHFSKRAKTTTTTWSADWIHVSGSQQLRVHHHKPYLPVATIFQGGKKVAQKPPSGDPVSLNCQVDYNGKCSWSYSSKMSRSVRRYQRVFHLCVEISRDAPERIAVGRALLIAVTDTLSLPLLQTGSFVPRGSAGPHVREAVTRWRAGTCSGDQTLTGTWVGTPDKTLGDTWGRFWTGRERTFPKERRKGAELLL